MIRINLLPLEFRKEARPRRLPWTRGQLGKAAGIFFLGLTVIFYLQYLWAVRTLKSLQREWPTFQQELKRVSQTQAEVEGGIKNEKNFLEKFITTPVSTTTILSAVTEFLPNSVWLVELKVSRSPKENLFLLKGLCRAPSRHTGIQEIETYLRGVKDKFPPETNLMLTTTRQEKEGVELTLFTAIFKWT